MGTEDTTKPKNNKDNQIKDWIIKHFPTITIGLSSALLVTIIHFSGILNPYELKLLDLKYQQRGPLSGNDALSAWPASESFDDTGNGKWDEGEEFDDTGNGKWDEGEEFDDSNGNGKWDDGEDLWDDFGNGKWDEGESFLDIGNGVFDSNDRLNDEGVGCWEEEICGNGQWDEWENLNDSNSNGKWDEGESWEETDKCQEDNLVCYQNSCVEYKECHDLNKNGIRDKGLDVVIVAGPDDESFRLINEPYPYPRGRVYARALDNLSKAGAKVVAFDYVFDKPDHFTKNINLYKDSNPQSFKGQVVDGDQQLLESIKKAREGNGRWDKGENYNDSNGNGKRDEGEPFSDIGTIVIISSQIKYEPTRFPPDYLLKSSRTLIDDEVKYSHGLVNQVSDEDGFSRRYPLVYQVSGDPALYYTLAIETVLKYKGYHGDYEPKIDMHNKKAFIGPLEIDLYTANSFMVNLLGGGSASLGTFRMIPLSNVLDTKDYNIGELVENSDFDPDFYDPTDPSTHSMIYLEDSNWMDNIINPDPFLASLGLAFENPFKDKIVILGTTLPEDQDFKNIPYTNYKGGTYLFAGVEFHASAIQHLLSDNSFWLPLGTLEFDFNQVIYQILLIISIVLLIMLLVSKAKPFTGFAIVSIALIVWIGYSFGAFIQDSLWILKFMFNQTGFSFAYNIPNAIDSIIIPVIYPSLAIILPFGINLTYKLFTEGQDKAFLKDTFGTYVSPDLIDIMYETKQSPQLGGDYVFNTCFFSDIASFSSFSEKMTAPELVELLNEYLEAMTNILLENGGTLDKYIGDAIIGIYGSPIPLNDHEYKGCVSICQMNEKLEDLRQKWKNEGDKWPEVVHNMRHRIGLNSGQIVAGNMGSSMRMGYTMMGDAVNATARLESGAKQYGIESQVGEHIYSKTKDKFCYRFIDHCRVMGKQEPLINYELISEKGKEPKSYKELIPLWDSAIGLYKLQKWDEAIEAFKKSEKFEEKYIPRKTNPSLVYIDRCKEFKRNPPEKDWDGVYNLKSK